MWLRVVLFDDKWREGEDSMLKDDICQKKSGVVLKFSNLDTTFSQLQPSLCSC